MASGVSAAAALWGAYEQSQAGRAQRRHYRDQRKEFQRQRQELQEERQRAEAEQQQAETAQRHERESMLRRRLAGGPGLLGRLGA